MGGNVDVKWVLQGRDACLSPWNVAVRKSSLSKSNTFLNLTPAMSYVSKFNSISIIGFSLSSVYNI